jgi:hypothetical protein
VICGGNLLALHFSAEDGELSDCAAPKHGAAEFLCGIYAGDLLAPEK